MKVEVAPGVLVMVGLTVAVGVGLTVGVNVMVAVGVTVEVTVAVFVEVRVRVCVEDAPGNNWQNALYSSSSSSVTSFRFCTNVFSIIA